MRINFDEITERRGSSCWKWDMESDVLPMWIADMDFKTAPEIVDAFKRRIDSGIFGYTFNSDGWYLSYIKWWRERHHLDIKREWMSFATGVIPIVTATVQKLTSEGDNVVLLTPIYNTFFNSIVNNHRNPLTSDMKYVDGSYYVDYQDLEEKLSREETKLFIFCNPHNPIGKVWEKEEIEKIGELCKKYNVVVLSDEIHCDIVKPTHEYTPFLSVESNIDNVVMAISPTKVFNLAGIQTACMVIPNEELRKKVNRQLNDIECAEPNVLAEIAPQVAFNECEYWVDEMNLYVDQNRNLVREFLKNELPVVKMVECDALYLIWLDFGNVIDDTTQFNEFLKEKTGLYLSSGENYRGNGNKFLRMNIATQRSRVEDGLNRLKDGLLSYITQK